MTHRINQDNADYFAFTGPMRLDQTLHSLEGILKGIAADGLLQAREVRALERWLDDNRELQNKHPFNEISAALTTALADDTLTPEEIADVLWLCERFHTDNIYFDAITSDMQRLHGMMAGCLFDGVITEDELKQLRAWMDDREHLRSCYPYDELQSLILAVLKDGRIDVHEQTMLKHFFAEFINYIGHRAVTKPDPADIDIGMPIAGLCAVDPDIVFPDKCFCFTGASEKAPRSEIAAIITKRNGLFSPRVTQDLDYLVVGADGNPCWAFSCYGRKVELAMKYRRAGCHMLIVHECDFWDAL
jgi:hypothetical protein